MSADVAIVIVSYNSERHIESCLRSVFAECRKLEQEVIVVDNASEDRTVELIRERYPQVRVLTPGRNLGFAAAVNLACRQTTAEFILLLNPDTLLLGGATDTIVEFARAHPEHGLYGGRTFKRDGSLEPSSCWDLPSLWSIALFACGLTALAPRSRWLNPESLGGWERDSTREVGMISGCFLLVRREVWEALGGFDERYFMYGEDADLAMRARANGLRPVICPDAHLVHDVGQSSATPADKMLLLYRGKAALLRFHWKGPSKHVGLLLMTVGVGLRALLSSAGTKLLGRPSSRRWETVWQERRHWLAGYPDASATNVRPAYQRSSSNCP